MAVVTVETLARALVDRLGIPAQEAEAQAEYVLDMFGFEGEVLDNLLEPEDRQLFYSMEAHGIVTARSEETPLHNGQDWRTHSWTLRHDRLRVPARALGPGPALGVPDADVYGSLPSAAWSRR